jgi:hypothetical protein
LLTSITSIKFSSKHMTSTFQSIFTESLTDECLLQPMNYMVHFDACLVACNKMQLNQIYNLYMPLFD